MATGVLLPGRMTCIDAADARKSSTASTSRLTVIPTIWATAKSLASWKLGKLARDPARRLALFQKAGLIDNQNRVLIAQRFQCILTRHIAQCVGIPSSSAQDRWPSKLGIHDKRELVSAMA